MKELFQRNMLGKVTYPLKVTQNESRDENIQKFHRRVNREETLHNWSPQASTMEQRSNGIWEGDRREKLTFDLWTSSFLTDFWNSSLKLPHIVLLRTMLLSLVSKNEIHIPHCSHEQLNRHQTQWEMEGVPRSNWIDEFIKEMVECLNLWEEWSNFCSLNEDCYTFMCETWAQMQKNFYWVIIDLSWFGEMVRSLFTWVMKWKSWNELFIFFSFGAQKIKLHRCSSSKWCDKMDWLSLSKWGEIGFNWSLLAYKLMTTTFSEEGRGNSFFFETGEKKY